MEEAVFGARVCRFRDSQSAVPGKARGGALGAGGGRVGFVCMQGQGGGVTGVSYRIRILMYFDVSCMYPDRILMCPVHIQDASRYNKIHILQIRTYLCIQLRYMYLIMYPSCIPHVSRMYPRTSADTCISYVSRMYPACIPRVRYMSLEESHMYPKMYLGLVRDTKYMQNIIHVFSWNVTGHLRYI